MLAPANVRRLSRIRLLPCGLTGLPLTGLSVVALLLGLSGCVSEQEEGKRCDLRNGSSDCAAALICRPASELSLPDNSEGVALCCPQPGQTVTVEECGSSNATLPDDIPVSDAGTQTSARTDAATGSRLTDAGSDTADSGATTTDASASN